MTLTLSSTLSPMGRDQPNLEAHNAAPERLRRDIGHKK